MSFSHIMITLTVFSFMLTIVNLLPSLVTSIQDRYKTREGQTSRELDKFFVTLKPSYIFIGSLVAAAVLGLLTESWVLAVVVGLIGTLAPKVILTVWKDIRCTQFDAQLMDALILISNALRSGLDIATGIELVTTNMQAPISEEFGLVLNAYRLGAPLEDAFTEMTFRIRSRSLETAVGAILLQRETGGNLVKTFEQLIITIREEAKLEKKVRALSAQGRTQITFLAAFPWVLAAIFYFLSPDMFQPALASTWGQSALAGMIVWEIIGIVVTKRIVTVDV